MPLDGIADHNTTTKAWTPDAGCVAAGDRLLIDAVRAYAAAGLSDPEIEDRVLAAFGWTVVIEPPEGRDPDPELPFAENFPKLVRAMGRKP